MDFDFSEDQQSLRDAVRRWVDKGYTFERRRGIVAAGGFDRAAYGELAELGLTALTVPEAHDGLGQGAVDAMVAMEELGRGIVLEPLAQTFVASGVLAQCAPEAVQAAWLPRIASGEALVVLAHQERKARYRLDACEAQATGSGDGVTVLGTKSLVPAGDQADAFLVPAQHQGRMALFLVERGAQGVAARGYVTQDGSRAAEVQFNGAPATLVAEDGLAALELAVDIGIAAACAEAVGVMDQTVSLTVDYMNQRKQFGVPIASFQALRHRVADMKMQLELARSMSYYASLKLGAPTEERRRALSRAKVQLGQSMRFVGQQSVQLHGGIGVTDEYIGSHYFKKLTQLEMTWGDTLHHLGEVSARMQDTAGVFA
ncbi:acyl-CoA dehydrogenase family protein [Acidovorax sp. NCPPB 3859]|nr:MULTISPECIES: acyl-CoA dehydrogenase family protein [unclassified Acidovorax]MDA8451594.1 acyl-CoA dehydrogenase family protein [Acidovorax sp. GBBC 3297]MDA8461010.1 acyl-CoA dehydrogenase family protein [Acidovorax sp. GBBC 3333]MDA8466044.1 acyl-CoA dehydrogenase family protein [Acidovorax sp. GBBC 3332]MDA8471080.1 acyl-CoA dehydrogenase family protein [Acidovorax sp. GBBC 3299]WCM77295.1 acyl-CoA dehydrogenase family protein [Acidovorax sp. GBBC 712]